MLESSKRKENRMEDPVFTLFQNLSKTVSERIENMDEAPQKNESNYFYQVFNMIMAQKENINYNEILDVIRSQIKFDKNLFQTLINQENLDTHQQCEILILCMSWFMDPSISDIKNVIQIVTSLDLISPIKNAYEIYLKSMYYELFNEIFSDFTKSFVQKKEEFFQLEYLLPMFLEMAIDKSKKLNKVGLTDDILNVLQFCNDLCEENMVQFTKDTSLLIIDLIMPYIDTLDKQILSVFANFSKELTDNFHSSLVVQLIHPLSNKIQSAPPFISSDHLLDNQDENLNSKFDLLDCLKGITQISFPVQFSMAKLETDYKFVKKPTFLNGVDIHKMMNFSEKPDLNSLVPSKIYEILDKIVKILINREPSQIAIISSLAQNLQNSNPYFFDYAIILIIIFKGIKNSNLFPLFWNSLFDTILFDERINMYNISSKFLIFDQFRSLIFDCFTIDNFSFLAEVLSSFTSKPALIDEIIQRILLYINVISANAITDPKFIQNISLLQIYFQNLDFLCSDSSELISIIEDTRSSLFFLVMKVFEYDTYHIRLWLSNMLFLSTFFSFLFEKPVRPIILNLIKNYIITTNTHFYYGTIEKIEEIVSLMNNEIPNENALDLLCDILQIICEFQLHRRRQNLQLFDNLSKIICDSLQFLINTPSCSKYLIHVVSFLSTLNEKLTQAQLDLLTVSILRVENDSPSLQLFSKLTQLLAGEQLSSTNSSFMIQQPGVLNLILTCYIHSNEFEYVFRFIKQLLEFSFYNISSAVNVGFDSLLLDQINLMKVDESNSKKIEIFLDIIEYICKLASSNETPSRYINLLYPIRKKWISPFEIIFTQKLINIIRTSMQMPRLWLPLGELNNTKSHITVNGITSSILPKSFLIVSWIYLDQSNSQDRNHIFEIFDVNQCGFIGFISSGYFLLSNLNTRYESTAKIEKQLPIGTWFPISVFVETTPDGKTYATSYIGNDRDRRIEYNWEGFADGKIYIVAGSTSIDFKEQNSISFLSSLSIYHSRSVKNISQFTEAGPHQLIKSPQNGGQRRKSVPKISFSPIKMRRSSTYEFHDSQYNQLNEEEECTILDESSSEFLIIKIDSEKGKISPKIKSKFSVTIDFKGDNIKEYTTFCSVLKKKDIVKLLLPLFTLMDYKTTQNKTFNDFPALLFDLFSTALQISRKQQEIFDKCHGMEILSYLLNRSNAYIPSYSTYMRIYTNLQSFIPPLQESVITLFLLDFKNMINSQPRDQIRLAKHWSRVLSAGYPIKSITPFLVLIFEQFLSDDPVIFKIRHYLNEIVLKVAATNIDEVGLLSLISLPLSSPIEYQKTITYEVLTILHGLVNNRDSALHKLNQKTSDNNSSNNQILKCLTLTNLYLQTAETDVMISLLRLIVNIHKSKLLNSIISLDAHIEMIIRECPYFYAQTSVVKGIAELACEENMLEILPLSFYLAANIGDDASVEIFKVFDMKAPQKPISLRTKFWTVVVAMKASRDVQRNALKFLHKFPGQDNFETAIIIDIVSEILNDHTNSLLREHLDYIINQIISNNRSDTVESLNSKEKLAFDEVSCKEPVELSLNNQSNTDSYIDNFFQLIFQFLMFRRQPQSSMLLHQYELSVFNRNEKLKRKSPNLKIPDHKNHIIHHHGKNENSTLLDLALSCKKVSLSDMRSMSGMMKPNEKGICEKVSRSVSFHKLLLMINDDENIPINHNNGCCISQSESSSEAGDRKLSFKSRLLYNEILKYSQRQHPRVLGIRLDRNGNWIDRDIGYKCLQIFEKYPLPFYIPFDFMISAYLVQKNRSQVEKHLTALNLNLKQITSNINSVNLLSKYSSGKLNKKFEWVPSQYDNQMVELAFEEMENRRSITKEKFLHKIAYDFSEQNIGIDKEIANVLSIRKNSNKSVYFIENEIIDFHSQELKNNEKAESYWKMVTPYSS